MSTTRKFVGRPVPDQLPDVPLPFYVRSVGCHEAAQGWSVFFPAERRTFTQFFWCEEGAGDLEIAGRRHRLNGGDVMFCPPGEDHRHTAASPRWTYSWFTLDGPLAADFMRGFGFPSEPMPAGPCPEDLFLKLEALMREMSPRSQRCMLGVVAEILANAWNGHEAAGHANAVVDRFIALAGMNFQNPAMNVNVMADRLGVHRTTLDRLCKRQLRMDPGEYLARLRVQRALSLLRGTGHPVFKVGELSGIPNRGYFCKLVRKAAGVTPKAYRQHASS